MSSNIDFNISPPKLNLDQDSVRNFFVDENINDALLRYIEKLDSADHWAFDYVDDEDVQATLYEVEHTFATYGKYFHLFPDKVIFILSRMRTSRCLFLVNYLCGVNPEFTTILESLLSKANNIVPEENVLSEIEILLQRFQVLERTKILEKVYSHERYATIIRVMKAKGGIK
jgi:hypothetical protein